MIQIVLSVTCSKWQMVTLSSLMNVAHHRLTNCRMGSVEVMETFCYNLSKNTSLVELRLLLNIVWFNFIIGTFIISLTNVGIKQDSLVVLLKGLQKLENIRVLR